jgi:hypothetical protein
MAGIMMHELPPHSLRRIAVTRSQHSPEVLGDLSGRKVYCIANPYFFGETDDP